MSYEVTKLMDKLNNYSVNISKLSITDGLRSHSIGNDNKSVNFFKFSMKEVKISAKTTKLNTKIDFVFINEGLQLSRYVPGISNVLYTDHSVICMRFSSDQKDEFYLRCSDNLIEFPESYANIQVDKGCK